MGVVSFKNLRCAVGYFCIFLSSSLLAATLIDRVVAVVDGVPILQSEVDEKIKKGPLVALSDWPSEESSPQNQRALNDLINVKLVLKKADELELNVEEADLESQISKLLSSQGADKKALDDFLKQQGKTYDQYKEDFKHQMIVRRFQGRVIMPLVKITERDIQSHYLKVSGNSAQSARVDLKQMSFQLTGNPNLDASKLKTAKDVVLRAKKGEDFMNLAKVYADAQTTLKDLKTSDVVGSIRQAISSLGIGDVSEVVQVGKQAFIFQVEKQELSGDSNFMAKKEEIENDLRAKEIDSQTRRWLEIERERRKLVLIP
ncbi:MAG: SurA N-terminal domain-containing protein [Pseudomonadota bacterium]